ncbi:S-layer homology domain-containing protein [Candidatus Avoscillospira sp. LCP25S3_F1]|uniref:S-layer homology domain-containing protein n=1 Tax=Candidatus Avoscillospira sp. LCP25S3_F1 TaxID=3438825 RepID=UPI003F8F2015
MKNLKKVLALVLAMSTVFGLSATAGAAATDFNDYNEIGNKEAVEVMAALNVIGGNNNGDFNPDGYLTRAEMCKMVSYVMNGGKAPVLSTSATPSYSDIKGHWGEAYIEYATSMGIVGGVGGGKFSPDSSLTGTQAAKMMLTAMGYDATVFGFGGTGWDVNVNRYANEAGLYDDLSDMQPNLPITRDQAAQLMYNAMQATMMKRSWSLNPATGEQTESYSQWIITNNDGTTTPVTLLSEKYNGAIQIGYMSDFSYDSVKNEWTYTFDSTTNTFGGNSITAQNKINNGTTQKSSVDYTDLFGQQVKVIYNTKDQKVTYGVYANDSSVVATGATGNVEDVNNTANTVTVSGKDYKLKDSASNINVYNVGSTAYATGSDTSVLKLAGLKTEKSAYDFKLVDNTGDGKIDAAICTPMTVAKINYVGKDTVQFSNGIGSVKIDDLTTYSGYAAGDWVYYIKAANSSTEKDTIVKADLKTGTIDGVRGGDTVTAYTEYQIGGTWLAASNVNPYSANIVKAEVGDTVEYVSLGSTIFYSKITDVAATSKSIAMVVTAGTTSATNGLTNGELQAKLLFADGTSKTAKITKINGASVGTADVSTLNDLIGTLVTYRPDGSSYELTTVRNDSNPSDNVNDANLAGYKALVIANPGYNNGKVNGQELADDAVVYFFGSTVGVGASNKADVYTGKEIKNTWGTATKALTTSVLTQEVNGFTYAKVAVIVDPSGLPEITAGSNYGYLSAQTYRTTEDNKTYLNFTIHTANGELKAKAESTDAPNTYPQGAVITYDVVSDGVIKNVNLANVTTGMVTGWDGDSKIALDYTSSEVNAKDTTVLYVDSDKKIGVEGGSIQKAADMNGDGTADQANVRYILAANHVVLLVVDVNNEMKANPVSATASVTTETALKDALKYDNMTVTVSDNVSVTGGLHLNGNTVSVASGKTLTVDNLYLEGGNLAGAGSVNVTNTTYMGSTLSVANFTTVNADIASGASMVISGGNVTITGNVTGSGKLTVNNAAVVTITGSASVVIVVNNTASVAVHGGMTGSGTITNNGTGTVTNNGTGVYKNSQDTTTKAVKVVK